jgi:hypothetical protein
MHLPLAFTCKTQVGDPGAKESAAFSEEFLVGRQGSPMRDPPSLLGERQAQELEQTSRSAGAEERAIAPKSSLRQFIGPVAGPLELALPYQFIPHDLRELVGRRDRDDGRASAGAQVAAAQLRLVVQPGELQTFAEGFEGLLEVVASR